MDGKTIVLRAHTFFHIDQNRYTSTLSQHTLQAPSWSTPYLGRNSGMAVVPEPLPPMI
jgi:hypothetical protein